MENKKEIISEAMETSILNQNLKNTCSKIFDDLSDPLNRYSSMTEYFGNRETVQLKDSKNSKFTNLIGGEPTTPAKKIIEIIKHNKHTTLSDINLNEVYKDFNDYYEVLESSYAEIGTVKEIASKDEIQFIKDLKALDASKSPNAFIMHKLERDEYFEIIDSVQVFEKFAKGVIEEVETKGKAGFMLDHAQSVIDSYQIIENYKKTGKISRR